MSFRDYPNRDLYILPKKNVLVLSCIDLRLTDNLLEFLHFDNLTNRYDHFALAGTSLMTQIGHPKLKKLFDRRALAEVPGHKYWKQTWLDHLAIAIELHQVKDVYIIEYEDCGAYKTFLKEQYTKSSELNRHSEFVTALATETHHSTGLNVHCFFLDMRGNVTHIYSLGRRMYRKS